MNTDMTGSDVESILRRALGEGDGTASLLAGWSGSLATAPAGVPFFLDPPYVEEAAGLADLEPELTRAAVATARAVAADPVARLLAWHVYSRVVHDPTFGWGVPDLWPMPEALLGLLSSLFYLLPLLGGVRQARALHDAHRVPREVTRETLHDMQVWASYYRRRHGTWGLAPRQLAWLSIHLRGRLFQLGRLQYDMGTWRLAARAFRHVASGRVVALSEHGVRYRADGQCDGTGGVFDPTGSWTAVLDLGADVITGHRILPEGRAERGLTRLARGEWTPVLSPGDNVLHLHIPRGGPLDLEACRRSLEQAQHFFSTYFPEWPFAAFSCHSWLLDPQLADWLPPTSNMIRFQRQVYLLPVVGESGFALRFVFGETPADLSQAPRDTALQRALLDHLLAGGQWHAGGCFLLPDDLPAWGSDVYRGDNAGVQRRG